MKFNKHVFIVSLLTFLLISIGIYLHAFYEVEDVKVISYSGKVENVTIEKNGLYSVSFTLEGEDFVCKTKSSDRKLNRLYEKLYFELQPLPTISLLIRTKVETKTAFNKINHNNKIYFVCNIKNKDFVFEPYELYNQKSKSTSTPKPYAYLMYLYSLLLLYSIIRKTYLDKTK